MDRRVYLYAFNTLMKVVDCQFLKEENISIQNIVRIANWMKRTNPEKVIVYAIDNRNGLYKDYKEAIKTTDFTKHVEFADMVSREGILVA